MKTKNVSQSKKLVDYATEFKTSCDFMVSGETTDILKLIVAFDNIWGEILKFAEDYYADTEFGERIHKPFSEIENELGKILMDSVTEKTSRSDGHVI